MHRRLVSTCAATALLLTACSGDDDQALQERLDQLEAQLAGEDDDAGGDQGDGADGADDGADDGDDDEAGDEGDGIGDPAEPRTVDISETFSQDGLEIVVERLVAHEFHTEIDLVATNRTADESIIVLDNINFGRVQLFDDRDRRFVYQHPAGADTRLAIEPGERIEATATFRGAVQADAELVTLVLQLSESSDRDNVQVQIPVGGS